MQTNFLEELTAEWLEYNGYIVKRNECVGRRAKGGHEGELDVVGFKPKERKLVHIETSTDADSWAKREEKFSKKFKIGEKHIKHLFDGLELPNEIEKKVILGFGSDVNHKTIGGGKIILAEDFIIEILSHLKTRSFLSRSVPEKYPILRVLHMITEHKKKVLSELK